MENQFGKKKLKYPNSIREAASKNSVDDFFNKPSVIENTAHVDFNDKNPDFVRFFIVNSMPAADEHLSAEFSVDQVISNSVDGPTLVRNNQDNDFYNFSLSNINSITSKTQADNNNQVDTESFVDQFHREKERSRRD